MCDLCKRTYCTPACPNHGSEKSSVMRRLGRPRCLLCGELVGGGKAYYQRNGFPYCEACMEVIDTDLLIRICETNRVDWLEKMGFSRVDD